MLVAPSPKKQTATCSVPRYCADHGDAEPSSDRLLSEREMARALDQVLHEKIVRALLDQPYLEHSAVQFQPGHPVRVGVCGRARGLCLAHGIPRLSDVSTRWRWEAQPRETK